MYSIVMDEPKNTVKELRGIAEYYERGQSEIELIRDRINGKNQHVGALHYDPNTGNYYICYGRIDGEFKWTRLKEQEQGQDFDLFYNQSEQV